MMNLTMPMLSTYIYTRVYIYIIYYAIYNIYIYIYILLTSFARERVPVTEKKKIAMPMLSARYLVRDTHFFFTLTDKKITMPMLSARYLSSISDFLLASFARERVPVTDTKKILNGH
jgi:hypothetical protein